MIGNDMEVVKRTGNREKVLFDKISNRVKKIGLEQSVDNINYTELAIKVIEQLYDGIPTSQIDELTAQQCAAMATTHLDYGKLGGAILVSNHHKNTNSLNHERKATFWSTCSKLWQATDILGNHSPIITRELFNIVDTNQELFHSWIDYSRDYLFDYFGFKTLERAYLLKVKGIIVERPQDMWMRVAIGIHGDNLTCIKETYDHLSTFSFTHATPTLFNAGTHRPQLSSCYLIAMEKDSIDGIFSTLKDCAAISKLAGGIGIHIHNIRAKGSLIRGTNGTSNGIVPMLRVFNNTARYVDQGGGRRNGSFAIYLEPWHADIEDFLEMRKNHGDEEARARDLFYALWVPDLFMERVKENGKWSLFCPDMCKMLYNCYGDTFKEYYTQYEEEGKAIRTVNARDLWFKILDSQIETGTPYILYKDACNKKSNQQNLGVIKSSNLCTEIVEYSDDKETAVCNLASINLSKFVIEDTKTYNYEELYKITRVVTRNLNKVIDVNYYPTEKTKTSNMRHRPIGIGVQGLADVFAKMRLPFQSEEARVINKNIFETIYYSALETSCELAQEIMPYVSFLDSPMAYGKFQFDLWEDKITHSGMWDWEKLRQDVMDYGIRNSLLVAPMPTASTSQLLGNNEAFEPFTSNIYVRRTIAGEFILVNKYLQKDLLELGIWNDEIKNSIIANKGSVQQLDISDELKELYKTVWEIPMKVLIDQAADRGHYICQSQSMNLWMESPNYKKLTSMHFYAWGKGLKTGIYYLRTKAKAAPQQFTIEPTKKSAEEEDDDDPICDMCSA